MEVKDVRSANLLSEAKSKQQLANKSSENNSQLKSEDAVASDVKSGNSKNQIRIQLNEVINATNVAKDATTQIGKIVQSISGIIKQASKDDIPPQRKATLEKEANDLVSEIKKAADTSTSSGIKPLAGDKIRLEVEEKLGKTLDVILPDDAKNAFGLNEINFSTKETIIATVANVHKAEESIKNLKKAIEEASRRIESTTSTVDVALQNSEAAESTIRDLDEALKLAGQTRGTIADNPNKAIQSLGSLGVKSLGLLE